MTPGWTVRVTPVFTAVGPVSVYGLPAGVQVVSEFSMPITFVPVWAEPTGTQPIMSQIERKIVKTRLDAKLFLEIVISVPRPWIN